MRPFVYPYKVGSHSARDLAEGLHTKCIYTDRNYKANDNHLVINWGNGSISNWHKKKQGKEIKYLNHPFNVSLAGNKLHAFQVFKGNDISCVTFTYSGAEAKEWVKEGKIVVARTKLKSHSGNGIVMLDNVDEWVNAPLYTVYKKKRKEYRVHVMKGRVFDVQQKRRRTEAEEVDFQVRSYFNGWVYVREDVTIPFNLFELAKSAVGALGLDFGAVDIIWNRKEDMCYVLEVNTAPGLEGMTLINYIQEIETNVLT